MVEFALVLPVIMLLLLITLDFGRLFMTWVTLTNASRIAANFGATAPGAFSGSGPYTTYDSLVSRETGGLGGCALLPDSNNNNPPIPVYDPSSAVLNATSSVTFTCNFTLWTPLISNFFGGTLPISASAHFPVRTGAIANIGGTTTLPPPGSPVAAFDFTGVTGGSIDGSGNVSGVDSVTVNVTDNSANAQTWDWSWGDSTTDDTVPNPPIHTYGAPGFYTVTLTVTNPVGTSSFSRTVTVTSSGTQPAVAAFYGTPVPNPPNYVSGGGAPPSGTAISGSLPLQVQFTNTSTNGTGYSWAFGDGGSSTSAAPVYQYNSLGVFSVTLSITSPIGGTPQTRTSYVTTGCVIPNFANTSTDTAQTSWANANLSGTIWYRAFGSNGAGSKKAPSPAATIVKQSVPGGTFVPATKQGNQPWQCAGDITVDYQ